MYVVWQHIVDKTYGIHKIHANYGRLFSELSALDKEMGDGLQMAGHYMDVWVSQANLSNMHEWMHACMIGWLNLLI